MRDEAFCCVGKADGVETQDLFSALGMELSSADVGKERSESGIEFVPEICQRDIG